MVDNSNSADSEKVKVSLELNLTKEVFNVLDVLKDEYGAQSRARVIELILEDLVRGD